MTRRRQRPLVATPTESSRSTPTAIAAEREAPDAIAQATATLNQDGRRAIGVTGTEDAPPLREAIGRSGVGWYPVIALSLLVAVDEFHTNAMLLLGPEITASLGVPRAALATTVLLKTLVLTVVALPIAALVQQRPRRAMVSVSTAFAWSVLTVATGFAVSIWGLVAIAMANGASAASVQAVHQPLLLDSYPPESRVRAMSLYRGFDALGKILAPVLIGLSVVIFDLTWRGVFVVLGATCFFAALGAVKLRDPGFGRWDTERLRELAGRGGKPQQEDATPADVSLRFWEVTRRVLLIPTVRTVLVANAVLGMMLIPLITYLAFFLAEEWGMGPGSRAAFTAVAQALALVALLVFGRRGEEMFRQDPARLLRLAGTLMALAVTCLAAALFTPVFLIMAALFAVAVALTAVLMPPMHIAIFSVVPATMRPHLAALSGIALVGVGGAMGVLLLSTVDRRYGTVGAILSLAGPGIVAGIILHRGARTINSDLDQMIASVIEDEQVRELSRTGAKVPLLSCSHIDFSYDQLQVLFDVSFTVDDGEMVALLGTNGAGKSTLLRVISGLGLPSRGSVRFRGLDITYLDASRRVGLGIRQIAGGRGTFPSLSVVDNLRAAGYAHGRDRRAVDAGIEEALAVFPRLAERRNQPAVLMSGGESQMLALGAAFVVRPQILLIDELSLGLAPKVVGELLGMVRRINASGTAVVLVEQSVNIALSLVDRAYFMEKGSVRFDGSASDLLSRGDLLRSVFLEGASSVLAKR